MTHFTFLEVFLTLYYSPVQPLGARHVEAEILQKVGVEFQLKLWIHCNLVMSGTASPGKSMKADSSCVSAGGTVLRLGSDPPWARGLREAGCAAAAIPSDPGEGS